MPRQVPGKLLPKLRVNKTSYSLESVEYEVIVTNLACYLSSIYIIPKRTRGIIVKYIHKLSVE